jgi:hypothetical protein
MTTDLLKAFEQIDKLEAELGAVKAERDELKANLDEEQARFPLVYADMASARAERDAAIKERDRLRATMETLMLWLNGPHGTDGDYYLDGYVGTDEVIDRLDANPPRCARSMHETRESILASRFAQLHLKIIHLKKSRHEWKRRWAELQGGRVRRGIYIGRSDAEEAMKADDIYQYLFDLMRSYVGEVNGLPWEDNICEDCIHWNGSKCLHPNPTGSGDEGCDMYEDKKDDNTPMPGGPF